MANLQSFNETADIYSRMIVMTAWWWMMKKKLLIVAAVLGLLLVVLVVGVSGDDPLDPAVQEIMDFRFPEVASKDNAYVGISGLPHIDDGDIVAAGEKYLKTIPTGPEDPNLKVKFDPSYKNPCQDEKVKNCLSQIVADAQTINETVGKNREIIERYRQLQKMPLYVNNSVSFMDRVPRYDHPLNASKLLGAKALLDIKQQGLGAGLDVLETDLTFYKGISQSEYLSLIDLMIAMAAIKVQLVEINAILEDSRIDLTGYEERLRAMLTLNLDANRMMASALKSEKRVFVKGFEESLEGLYFAEPGFTDRLKQKLGLFLLKKNMTLNLIAAKLDRTIQHVESFPVLNFPEFFAEEEAREQSLVNYSEPRVKDLYDRYGVFFFKNYTGELMANIAQPLYMRYVARINDTLVYSRLLRTQLELRLMADRPEDVSKALAELGPETYNPYTGAPFAWDKEKNVIWAESASNAVITSGNKGQGSSAARLQVEVPALPTETSGM